MNYAVIKTGGKQYLVQAGGSLKVEKLPQDAGEKVTFDEVLLTADDKQASVGAPLLPRVTVEGTVIRHGQRDKVTGVKMKSKKRYKKYFGHRQQFTEIQITKIA